MSRPRGSIIGAKPTWTTTATSGIWTLRQAEEMKADGKWPRGPVAPTSLAGTAGNEQVALTWTAPATTHGTITDYVVEYTPAAGSPTVVATGSTAASYTLTGLTNDTEYTFRVAAVNHTRGDWSDSVAVTPSAAPADANFADVALLLHFDTDFSDSSSNSHAVSNSGASISSAESKFGGASAYFNGSANIFTGTESTLGVGSGDWTLEFWIRPTSIGSRRGIIGRSEFDPDEGVRLTSSGAITWKRQGSGDVVTSTTNLSANTWYFVAFRYSSGTLSVWVDGVEEDSASVSNAFNGVFAFSYIGQSYSDSRFVGYLDDMRLTVGVARTITVPTAAFPDSA